MEDMLRLPGDTVLPHEDTVPPMPEATAPPAPEVTVPPHEAALPPPPHEATVPPSLLEATVAPHEATVPPAAEAIVHPTPPLASVRGISVLSERNLETGES